MRGLAEHALERGVGVADGDLRLPPQIGERGIGRVGLAQCRKRGGEIVAVGPDRAGETVAQALALPLRPEAVAGGEGQRRTDYRVSDAVGEIEPGIGAAGADQQHDDRRQEGDGIAVAPADEREGGEEQRRDGGVERGGAVRRREQDACHDGAGDGAERALQGACDGAAIFGLQDHQRGERQPDPVRQLVAGDDRRAEGGDHGDAQRVAEDGGARRQMRAHRRCCSAAGAT